MQRIPDLAHLLSEISGPEPLTFFVMRFRKVSAFIGAGTLGLIAVLCVPMPRRAPQVRLVHLARAYSNPVGPPPDPSAWSMGNAFGDRNEVWNAEFDVKNAEGSRILLSHKEVQVNFIGPTGEWTAAVSKDPSREQELDVFPDSESMFPIETKRVRASIPSGTRRCRLAIRFRPLTAQERCLETLIRWGFWSRFPKASGWVVDRLPTIKKWRETRPEIELPQVPIEQAGHNYRSETNPAITFRL